MKFLASFFLIFLLFELQSVGFCENVDQVAGDYHIGHRAVGDLLVQERVARKKPGRRIMGIFNVVVDQTFNITLENSPRKKITAIHIVQQKEEEFKASRLGEINLLQGGISQNYISLKLSSERGYGFHYKVYVFAK